MVINIPQTYKILSFAKNTFIIFANDSTTYIFTPMKYIFFLVVITACTNPSKEQQAMQMDSLRNRISVLENAMAINCSRLDILEQDVDSTKKAVVWIGNVAMKHDSAISDRDWKRDRSRRRGQFWGGIIKSLIK